MKRPIVAVVAYSRADAVEWVARNHLAFMGVEVVTTGAREGVIRLRGRNFDGAYVVSGTTRGKVLDLSRDPQLEATIVNSLLISGGPMRVVAPADRVQPFITHRCDLDECVRAAKVVVTNISGIVTTTTPACPEHAARYVGETTTSIHPIVSGSQ